MTNRLAFRLLLHLANFIVLSACALAQWTAPNPVLDFQKQPDGVLIHQKTGTLRFQVCSPAIIHLIYSPTADFPANPNPVIIKTSWPTTDWKLEDSAEAVALTTSAVKVAVDRKTGSITYSDNAGHVLLHDDSKTMTPVTVNGEKTYRAEDYMTLGGYGSTEALYGLGQHQAGVWNYRGDSVDLSQDNTSIAVPLHGLKRRLRTLLEQHVAQPLQQPLRAFAVCQLRSGRHHRLLLSLRPRVRLRRRRISRANRRGSHVRQVGLRLLAMQEQVSVAGRVAGRGAEVSRPQDSHR